MTKGADAVSSGQVYASLKIYSKYITHAVVLTSVKVANNHTYFTKFSENYWKINDQYYKIKRRRWWVNTETTPGVGKIPSEHGAATQRSFNAEPASQTVHQQSSTKTTWGQLLVFACNCKNNRLKGLAQAKIIKKSVILFWFLNMTIWCKHVNRLELQKFFNFCAAHLPVRLDIETKFSYFLFLTWLSKIRNQNWVGLLIKGTKRIWKH